MATFKAVVRKQRTDGFFAVYIRIVHRSRMGYIKTEKIVSPKQLTKSGDIKDSIVNEYCAHIIREYTDKINRKDISMMSVSEVVEYLVNSDEEVCFSEYAEKHINKMINRGRNVMSKIINWQSNILKDFLVQIA